VQTSIEGFQLSPQQLRLCSLRQAHDIYHASGSIDIAGPVDSVRLKQAINCVVAQHAIFRTTFHRLPGVKIPVQVINETGEIAWQYHDLREYTTQEQTCQIEEIIRQVQSQPVDLERGPSLFCTLITLSTDRHLLFIWMHALHGDNGTLHLFMRAVAGAYNSPLAFLQDEENIQYIQVSEWQNELMQEEDADEGKAWWDEQYQPGPAVGSLPHERKQERHRDFVPAGLVQPVAPEIQEKIEELAAVYSISPSIYLLSCWYILLWRLTGQEQLLMSVSVDGRINEELAQVFGPLTKSLPLPGSLQEQQNIVEVLWQVRERLDEALQQQLYFCYQDASSDAGFAGDPSIPCSFEYNTWPADYTTDAITFSFQTWHTYLEPFKVKLFARHKRQTLVLELHYDSALFEREQVQRLLEQYYTLLCSSVHQPMTPIGRLEILGERERRYLLTTLNEPAAVYPKGPSLHQLFEEQTLKSPWAIALRCEERTLTYAELDQQANQVAHYLRSSGVKAESLVGIYMERCVEMLIAILGVLKAGGAYVPMDPLYPAERLAFMSADADMVIILSQQHLIKDIPQTARAIALDQDWEMIAQQSDSRLIESTDDTALAYVIYTSGSTGVPKGVMVPHRGLVHYLSWCCQRYAVESGQGSIVHSSPAFDLMITSLFAPLLAGRTVHLLPDKQGVEGLGRALLQKNDYSLVKLTPAHLDLLNHTFSSSAIAALTRTLIIGGEALQGESLKLWREQAPETHLINEYGPTETVVGCCIYEVPHQAAISGNVPIGRPIANTSLYLLDTYLQLVPFGVAGELYIGGCGVARGYLNRADLTAERFLPDPFAVEPGMRLYKTGDLARYLPDGNLEFLGRTDYQIKVRGFRIEPGEIEAALCQHPVVNDSVVLARGEGATDRRLVAYVATDQVQSITADDLRRHLQKTLPEYMLPSAFVFLTALPLTPNGKIDREALPASDAATAQVRPKDALPRNLIEEVLVTFWQQLLHLERVGVNADFFNLGGHSLLATQLVSYILSVFQVEVSLLDLFETPTIAGLAGQIEAMLRTDQKVHMPALVPVSHEQDLPVSFAQERLWFLSQLMPDSSFYNIASASRLSGALNVEVLERCISEIVRRHSSLRTTFQMKEGQLVQIIDDVGACPLLLIDLSALSQQQGEEESYRLAKQEAERPFNLARGPLLRTRLLRLEKSEHVLLYTMHHSISDGWSGDILSREATMLYTAFLAGKPSLLPELPVQYVDFAVWQRQWLQGEVLQRQVDYWRQQLQGSPPVLMLPTDRQRPPVQTYSGARLALQIGPELTSALKQVSRREAVTLFMTLLAAFQVLLARSSGQEDIAVGTFIANRNHAGVEGLIGFFVNTLVLRTDLSGNPPFSQLLHRVREVALGAYVHQDLPFDKLVEVLQPERDPSYSPLFQVAFGLQGVAVDPAEQSDLIVAPLAVDRISAKFDLFLSLDDLGDTLAGWFEYNVDLFDATSIEQLAQFYLHILEAVSTQPELRLSELVISERERSQLASRFNDDLEYE